MLMTPGFGFMPKQGSFFVKKHVKKLKRSLIALEQIYIIVSRCMKFGFQFKFPKLSA
jgi:hypothetical protein